MSNIFKSFMGTPTEPEHTEPPKQFFQLADYVALNKASKYMWANGYRLEAEEGRSKDTLQDILDRNEALTMFTQSEYNVSKRTDGNQLTYAQPNEQGEVMFGLIDMPTEDLINVDPYGRVHFARTTIEATYGSYFFRIYQVWGPRKMITIISYKDNAGTYVDMDLSKDEDVSIYNLIPMSMRFVKEFEYEEIPLALITNYKSIGYKSYGDASMASDLQYLMDESFASEVWELQQNITRTHKTGRDSEVKSGFKLKTLFGPRRTTVGTDGQGGDLSKVMEVQQGDPKLETFDLNQDSILKKYLSAAGYSNENDLEGTQTNLGITYTSKADIETTDKKRKDREVQLKAVLKMIIMVHNQFNFNITFEELPTISILALASVEKENAKADIALMAEHGVLTDDHLIDTLHDVNDDEHREQIKQDIRDSEFTNVKEVEEDKEED